MQSSTRPIALITGATSGLGFTFAQQLAKKGYDLVLVARDVARLATRAGELTAAHGVHVDTIAADLSTDEGLSNVLAHFTSGARVDLLVNNAGFGTKGLFARTDAAAQDRMVRLHVVAVSALTRAALPAMLERQTGGVITVASVASFVTSAGNTNYCATKAYQRFFMESLALETVGRGVTVQALCPGFTHTEFHERAAINMTTMPNFLWLNAEDVVRDSLAAYLRGGPVVVIPGAIYKLIVFLVRYLPKWLMSRATRKYRRDRG